ncbi:MAG: tetratricopeptide repeat protein [Candidatus Binatia bacterium]
MPGRGVVGWASLLLFCAFLNSPQISVTWAQISPEVRVYVDRAVVAYGEKKYDEALKELQEALRLSPESVDALYYQGLVYVALKRPADAQAAWEKARELRPTDLDVAFQLGAFYFGQKQYEKAEPLLREVYEPQPTRPNIGYYLGFMEYRKKNYREALRLLKGNVPSDDDFAQLTRFYTGLALTALGFPREARAQIDESLRIKPLSPLTAPAQRFGEVLEKAAERERFFRGELRLGIFFDSNVLVVPDPSTESTTQTLRDTKRRKSEGQLASLNLAYTWLRTPDWEGTVSHRFLQTYNDRLPELNTQSHTPTIAITNRGSIPGANGPLPYVTGLQLTYDFISLGDAGFTQRWIFNPFFTLVENEWNLTTLQFRYQWKDFLHDERVARREIRDAKNYMFGPLHFFIFEQGRHFIRLGYQYDIERAEGENWTYTGHRLLAGAQYTIPWYDIRLRYDLDFHWRNHNREHSQVPSNATGTIRRRDREPVHLISIAKDFLTDFTVSLEYLFDRNISNLPPFDYNRHVVTTSLTWRFDSSAFGFINKLASP